MSIHQSSGPDVLVTVYITNHNYGQYIQQSVESVFSQTMKNYEIIIIDDGSTDKSRSVIEQYKDNSKIRIIYQQRKGLNFTNNIALKLARGRYIMRLDADDYLDPNALLLLSNELESDARLALVFPDYYIVDTGGQITTMERRHTFKKDVSLLDQPAHGACTMIRRDFLIAAGGYDEAFSCQDGYDLWLKLSTRHKVVNINLPLFYYRQHGANLTRNEKRLLDTRAAMKRKHAIARKQVIKAVAVIPVRGVSVDPSCIALNKLNHTVLLDRAINNALSATTITSVVVTSSDEAVSTHMKKRYRGNQRIFYVRRPAEIARPNISLLDTLSIVLSHARVKKMRVNAVVSLAVEFPFLSGHSIDEAVDTLAIYRADSVLAVRPEDSMFLQHDGHGLKPILGQNKFTRLEREALWRNTGALLATRAKHVRAKRKLWDGAVSHIVLDQKSAHGIRSAFDLELARMLELDSYKALNAGDAF